MVITSLACAGTLLGFAGRRTASAGTSVAHHACGVVPGSVGRRLWLCELASHFRVQYAVILLISAGIWTGERHWAPALVALGALLANVRLIAPIYRRERRPPATGHTIRLCLANVFASNRSHERLRRAIRAADPDLIVLEEFTQEWLAALGDIAERYPHSKAVILERGFGIAIFSRLPLARAEVLYLPEAGPPPIVARVQTPGGLMTLIATHPLSPTTPRRTYYRNQQLARLAVLITAERGPVVVVGDLNMTSWSPVFQEFLRRSGLRDSRQGIGLQPSWPRGVPLARIPIDHCLISPQIAVHRRRLGPHIGSDHLPLFIDLGV